MNLVSEIVDLVLSDLVWKRVRLLFEIVGMKSGAYIFFGILVDHFPTFVRLQIVVVKKV